MARARPASCLATPRDLEVIRFVARMRFASAAQLARAFGMAERGARRRCGALRRAGLLRYERVLFGQPGVYLATAAGLGLAGSDLSPARIDLAGYRHHLAVVSLALDLLAASPGARWRSERELRHDRGLGVRAHLPDGVLLLPGGARVAVELELTPKTGRRLAGILRFYARCRDYDAVRYFLTTEGAVARLRRLAAPYPHIRAELWTWASGVPG